MSTDGVSIDVLDAAMNRLWEQRAEPVWDIRHPREMDEWRASIDLAMAAGTYSGNPYDYDPQLRWLRPTHER